MKSTSTQADWGRKQLQGRLSFTRQEVASLRRLIQLKDAGGPEAAQMIAGRLQELHFCAEDFDLDYSGLTRAQFDHLVSAGRIRVLELDDSGT